MMYRTVLFSIVLLMFIYPLFGQNNDINNIDSLLNVNDIKQKEIIKLKSELEKEEDSLLMVKKIFIESQYYGETFISWRSAYIFPTPEKNFMTSFMIKKDQKVKVIERVGEFYKVLYEGKIGYVNPILFNSEIELKEEEARRDSLEVIKSEEESVRLKQLEIENVIKRKEEKIQQRIREEEIRNKQKIREEEIRKQIEAKHKKLSDKYGIEIANKIISGKIWLGMTKEMAIESWGRADDINRTVTSNMIREQWVYGGISNRQYLYFENGILTTWQD